MQTRRLLLCVLALCCASMLLAQEMPQPKAVITIKPTDNPMQMEALKSLLKSDMDRLRGDKAWKPPTDDPAKISKADYLEALKPNLAYCLGAYGKEPATPKPYAYEAIPTFAAFYKGTGDPKYAELTLRAAKEFCLAVDEEVKNTLAAMEKSGGKRPSASLYWTYTYAYVLMGLWALEGAPQYQQMADMLGQSLGNRANAYPIYWERGPQNRSVDAAFWYDMALKFNPNIPRAKELKEYADLIWNDWWAPKDMEEDCSHYTWMDLLTVDAWARIRGVEWWKDPDARNFWISYAEQAAQDGTWPCYGDAGEHGYYFVGMTVEELAAARVKDGHYKWFAHRMFWNGRDRIEDLCAGIGYMTYVELALAYLYADDTIKEIPPKAGLLETKRRFRERTNWRAFWTNPNGGLFFELRNRWQPSKLVFRAGPKETDQFMLVQAGNQAGHGHPDTGSIILYNGDLSYYVANGASRMDDDMEQHNLFTLRDPVTNNTWYAHQLASEETSVPVKGQASDASYARLHIREFPGNTPTAESWQKLYDRWSKVNKNIWIYGDFPPEKAIGYKNWPVRMDRCILFVNNQFAVVRDVANFILPACAQLGQNWIFDQLGPTIGNNWVNVWIPRLYGFPYTNPPRKPVDFAQRDLLIWFAPQKDAVLQIVDGPTNSWYGNSFINMPRHVWYPRTGDWQPGQPQAFTTVLLPHKPIEDPENLAATITALQDTPDATVLKVTSGDTVRLIIMNTSGKPVTAGPLVTDAESALLTLVKGKPTHVSAWHATKVTLGKKTLLTSKQPKDLDRAVK
ncbi:MAG: hypothetical protein ACYDBB_11170 [Armatimonadota bacterium]